jgi:hypothetical protein
MQKLEKIRAWIAGAAVIWSLASAAAAQPDITAANTRIDDAQYALDQGRPAEAKSILQALMADRVFGFENHDFAPGRHIRAPLVRAGRHDPCEREVVIPGTYARVPSTPVGLMPALLAVPQGVVAGADVILTVLVVGGAFGLLDATGALGRLVGSLVGATRRPQLIVVFVSLAFATLGALENMGEEIIALIPALLVLSRGLGFGAVTALAMSIGAAVVGAAFGPTNPFQTGIALRFAEMPAMSQPVLRFSLFAVAVAVWIGWTLLMTARDDVRPETTRQAMRRGDDNFAAWADFKAWMDVAFARALIDEPNVRELAGDHRGGAVRRGVVDDCHGHLRVTDERLNTAQ